MFPEKIDKMILDGVQNPHQYYNSASCVPRKIQMRRNAEQEPSQQ